MTDTATISARGSHAVSAPTDLPELSPRSITKSALLRKLLVRTKGATLAELVAESGWQPHSARAWLTGVRKKSGASLRRETRRNGESCYRLVEAA